MRILLISYHFPPLNVIASNRAHAFAKYLHKFGIEFDLVTLDWQVKDGQAEVPVGTGFRTEHAEGGRVFRLHVQEAAKAGETVRWKIMRNWLLGYFDEGLASLHGPGRCFDAFVEEQVKREHYDALVGIFSPHQHLRTCANICRKHGIPYVLDFRDLWSNRILYRAYKPRLAERLHDVAVRFYWRKWLRKALFYSATSKPRQEMIGTLTNTPGYVITNGYDPDDFEQLPDKAVNEHLKLAHIGTLYESQVMEPFLEGFRRFADENHGSRVIFVGGDVPSWGQGLTARKRNVRAFLESYLKPDQFVLTGRLPRHEALGALKAADVCYFPSFPAVKGTYSGKFFEFLGSGNPILSVPADHGVVDEAMEQTGAGRVASTSEEVYQFLNEVKSGAYKHQPRSEVIRSFSRAATVKRFADLLFQHLELQKVDQGVS